MESAEAGPVQAGELRGREGVVEPVGSAGPMRGTDRGRRVSARSRSGTDLAATHGFRVGFVVAERGKDFMYRDHRD